MWRFIVVIAAAVFLTACLDAERKGYITEIDGMTEKLDSLESLYYSMPLDSFTVVREIAQNNEHSVKQFYDNDTIDAEFARAMNRYKAIRKGAGFITQKRNFLDTVFAFQKTQLSKLRTDILNGSGKRDKYETFINSERENVALITTSFMDFESRFVHLLEEFYETNPKVEEMIKNLKED